MERPWSPNELTHSPKAANDKTKNNYNEFTENINNEYDLTQTVHDKLWFFTGGKRFPNTSPKQRTIKLHPYEDPVNDRITNQLMYVPSNYEDVQETGKLKTILVFNGFTFRKGRTEFKHMKCPVDTCQLTDKRERADEADLIVYKDFYSPLGVRRPQQLTMLYLLESPYHTPSIKQHDAINWTATYR